jgi:hypothetical protein
VNRIPIERRRNIPTIELLYGVMTRILSKRWKRRSEKQNASERKKKRKKREKENESKKTERIC